MSAFEDALATAEQATKTAKTEEEFAAAEKELQNAIDTFQQAIKTTPAADFNTLDSTIETAREAKKDIETSEDGKLVEFDKYYANETAISTFDMAINNAEAVKTSAQKQSEIDDAVQELQQATSIFNGQKKLAEKDTDALELTIQEAEEEKEDVETSDDGLGVDPGKYWATAADIQTFENAISKATDAKTSATYQQEIDDAVEELEQAIETFQGQKTLAN